MELENIPAEVRWEISTKATMASAVGYGMALRQILDEDTVRQIELAIMSEAGKGIKSMAESLGLPAGNAKEVDDAFGVIGMILWGKMDYKIIESSSDKVVQRITRCPNLNYHEEMNVPIITMPDLCQTFSTSAVEELNPKYTQSYSKRMCEGDKYCEYVVELKKIK
ncbi:MULTISPECIES: L-2-amino-thiazoline-4-carboxylic acid hydrolase [Methanobacterium]|uniref:L-2-amino-thiazoline-4-carboxylic acid hydrolase n=1 Tax=Methanobacterium bryantii TaxID=2161 RepID=A0A2A2H9H8_METBR|nr:MULTISPECIES: L-2-amino-thiazoline-4-carboxylic acid hydrolase [Methanobacterium]OEC86984.1 hypothetical protein A9507_08765 [Methanobacterium sp. A39]PAV06047.1 hypothetical protein ASJ80_14510 [Methanobacterium bryantii]